MDNFTFQGPLGPIECLVEPNRSERNAVLVMAYVGHVLWHDFPLSGLPVVGRYFKKT